MTPFITIILPGLDGAAVLRQPLADLLEPEYPATVVPFPPDRLTGFDEIADYVMRHLPSEGKLVIVSESFSGPIALKVSERLGDRLAALVLVGSYVHNPFPWPVALLRFLVGPWLFWLPPPKWFIRWVIVGSRCLDHKMDLFQDVARWIRPGILAGRIRAAFVVDACEELKALKVPILNIVSKHDRVLPLRSEQMIGRIRPDIVPKYLDTGHCMIECWPQLVAPLIREFFEQSVNGRKSQP